MVADPEHMLNMRFAVDPINIGYKWHRIPTGLIGKLKMEGD
jgi:hypothetical protein